jgi:hypothetical protein
VILGLLLMLFGSLVSAPAMWENLPTCDMTRPIERRCREVAGQWGGVDGRLVHDPQPAVAP